MKRLSKYSHPHAEADPPAVIALGLSHYAEVGGTITCFVLVIQAMLCGNELYILHYSSLTMFWEQSCFS